MDTELLEQLKNLKNGSQADRRLALEWIIDLEKYVKSQNRIVTKEKFRYLIHIVYEKMLVLEEDYLYIECLQEALENTNFQKDELLFLKERLKKIRKEAKYEELIYVYELLNLLAEMGNERNKKIVQESKFCSYSRKGITFYGTEKLANPKELEIVVLEKVRTLESIK